MADNGHVTDGGQGLTDTGQPVTDGGQGLADTGHRWLFLADAVTDLNISERTVRRRVKAGELASRRADDGRVEIGIPVTDGGHVTDSGRPVADSVHVSDGGQTLTGIGQPVTGGGHEALSELTARIERLDDDKVHLRNQLAERDQELRDAEARHAEAMEYLRTDCESRLAELRQESARRVETSKVRIIDVERDLTVRDSTIVDLRRQVADQEAEMRAVLSKGQDEAMQLANRIAGLVDRQQETEARIYELAPVADRVPMLQAAVEEKDAALAEKDVSLSEREQEIGNMRQDIDTIASRPVTGPVFRLLTKGRLRR